MQSVKRKRGDEESRITHHALRYSLLITRYSLDERIVGLIVDNQPRARKGSGSSPHSKEEHPMKDAERWKKGAAKMKELFGREPQPGMMHEGFLDVTEENLFGDIWTRPGLELKERSMITVAALTVLARERELKTHLRGTLNAGISREKINEIMIHLAHYGG